MDTTSKLKLLQWISDAGVSRAWFAEQLGCSKPLISHWLHDRHRVSEHYAIQIERVTAGAVSADEVCDGVTFVRNQAGAVVGYVVEV